MIQRNPLMSILRPQAGLAGATASPLSASLEVFRFRMPLGGRGLGSQLNPPGPNLGPPCDEGMTDYVAADDYQHETWAMRAPMPTSSPTPAITIGGENLRFTDSERPELLSQPERGWRLRSLIVARVYHAIEFLLWGSAIL